VMCCEKSRELWPFLATRGDYRRKYAILTGHEHLT
jgi:hypothetical protein